MRAYRVLIVEDEVLIADTIERYVARRGYEVVGTATSYEEAVDQYLTTEPDIVILDIRLSGSKTGIDVAHFIREQVGAAPFVFLTSQIDYRSIQAAKRTFPAGYLSKPIHKESLYATMEIALHSRFMEEDTEHIELFDGSKHYLVPTKDILFLKADHIYVEVHLVGGKVIHQRGALRELVELLPWSDFVQTHRSYALNLYQVSHWQNQCIFVHGICIPISRARKKGVISRLKQILPDHSEHISYRSEQCA